MVLLEQISLKKHNSEDGESVSFKLLAHPLFTYLTMLKAHLKHNYPAINNAVQEMISKNKLKGRHSLTTVIDNDCLIFPSS